MLSNFFKYNLSSFAILFSLYIPSKVNEYQIFSSIFLALSSSLYHSEHKKKYYLLFDNIAITNMCVYCATKNVILSILLSLFTLCYNNKKMTQLIYLCCNIYRLPFLSVYIQIAWVLSMMHFYYIAEYKKITMSPINKYIWHITQGIGIGYHYESINLIEV